MKYIVVVEKRAEKELSKLPIEVYSKIIKEILTLSDHPRPRGSRKLEGSKNNYRLRVGDYRIIYAVEDKILYIYIISVGNRKDIYR